MKVPVDEYFGIDRFAEDVKHMAFMDPRMAIRSQIVTEMIRQLHIALRGPESLNADKAYQVFVRVMRLLSTYLPAEERRR